MKRSYSENDKATALALLTSHADNITATARDTQIPASTLRKWRNGEGINDDVAHKCEEKKAELADVFERVARRYLARAESDEAVSQTKGKDAVIAAATATDKMQLLRGAPSFDAVTAAREALAELRESPPPLDPQLVLTLAAKAYGVDATDLEVLN